MIETQVSVCQWIEETFGPAQTNARVVARANEEMAELVKDVTSNDRHDNLPDEMADIVIVLYRLATRMNVDLLGEVDKKMAINRNRQWKLDGTGCGYHVDVAKSNQVLDPYE